MNETNVSEPPNEPVLLDANNLLANPTKRQKSKRFPGVSSFEDDDLAAELFYGREEESQKLLHYILAENLVVVFSYSGYGKTSLLKARVFRKLREKNFCPILVRFNKKEGSPQQLIQLEADAFGTDNKLEVLHNQTDENDQSPNPLIRYFRSLEIWSADDKLLTPVIVLDQFEEIFTLAHNQPYITSFFEDLAGLLKECKEGNLQLKVIISIREDFLGHMEIMATNVPSVFTNRFRLEALRKAAAKEAITEPARKGVKGVAFASPPFHFSETSIAEILYFLSLKMIEGRWHPSEHIEPVQLQIICSELENKIIGGEIAPDKNGQITIQPGDYGGAEGLKKIAANFYDQQMVAMQRILRLTEKEKDAVKEVIETGLIAGTRRVPLAYDAVINKPGVNKDAIDLLIENKLLKLESHRGNSLLELSHDTLVAPVLKSGEERLKQKEKAKRKRKRLLVFYSLLFTLAIAVIVYLVYNNVRKKQAMQDKYYYTAMLAFRQNPTLGYKIALDGRAASGSTPKIDTLIAQFKRSNNTFITNKFYLDYPLASAAYFSKDKKEFTVLGDEKEQWLVKENRKLPSVKEDYFAVCKIGMDNLLVKMGVDQSSNNFFISLADDEKPIGSHISMTEADDTTLSDEEQTKIMVRKLEALVNQVASGGKRTYSLRFNSDNTGIVHAHDSTLLFSEYTCYLHDELRDKFFEFDLDNTAFKPFVTKPKKGKGGGKGFGAGVAKDERLKAMTVTHDFRYFIYSADSVRILNAALLRNGEVREKALDKSAGDVKLIAVSPDDSLILTAGNSNLARVWNMKGELVAVLKGHQANISFADFSNDGQEIITADENGQVFVWKLAKNIAPKDLVTFSPFDYRVLGLTEKQYNIESIYDTTTFAGLVAATEDYEASLSLSNTTLGDPDYYANLAASVDDVQLMYAAVLRTDSFTNLSDTDYNKSRLIDRYIGLLTQSYDYDAYKPHLADSTTKRLERFVQNYTAELVRKNNKELDLFSSNPYLQRIQEFLNSRKNYSGLLHFYANELSFLKTLKPDSTLTEQRLNRAKAGNFVNQSYFKLFVGDFKGAIDDSYTARKYDATDTILYTNMALGYLLSGQFEKAQEIYTTYKKTLRDSFLQDFAALESEGILPAKEAAINENVRKIKAFLNEGKTGDGPQKSLVL